MGFLVSIRNRSRFEILYTILKLCLRGKRTTHVLRSANLSHHQLMRYVSVLTRKGLLDFDGNEYTTTEDGVLFIQRFENILALTTEEAPLRHAF